LHDQEQISKSNRRLSFTALYAASATDHAMVTREQLWMSDVSTAYPVFSLINWISETFLLVLHSAS